MIDLRLSTFRTGRAPLCGEEISIKTGRPKSDLSFGLLVESRFSGANETVVISKPKPITCTGFTEHDLMDTRVTAKLEELGMSGGGFHISLSKKGTIVVRDPDGDICCIIKRTEEGELTHSAWRTQYMVRTRNEKLAATAGLSPFL